MRSWLGRWRRRLLGGDLRRAVAGARASRAALMMYSTAAFRRARVPERHQNQSQQRELAQALAEHGYVVDAVDFDERRTAGLRARYDLVVDLHPDTHTLYEGHRAPGARTIAYMTGCDPAHAAAAERARLDALERRRGVRLAPRRAVRPIPAAVYPTFDAMFLMGGRATLASYAPYRLPPVHHLPNNGWDDLEPTDAAVREPHRFLFLGSAGQVHKGLDLLLETFRDAPELELNVLSLYEREPDFVRAYAHELFRLPNVHAGGFPDLRDPAFRALQARCGWMILPSCAEGQAGTVTLALAYGLPCVVSTACGFDDAELVTLPDCELPTLARTARALAGESGRALAERSAVARALYLQRYRPRHYAEAVRAALDALHGAGAASAASPRHSAGFAT